MEATAETRPPPAGRYFERVNERPQISLVMLSGGLDSVYSLYRLLTETQDEIVVHHMNLLNDSGRFRLELKAVRDVVRYCNEKIRPVRTSITTIDHRGFPAHGRDFVATSFEAAVVAASLERATGKKVGRWVMGCPSEEASPRRFLDCQRIFEMVYPQRPLPKLFLFRAVSKQEEADALPYELFRMCWCCRLPTPSGDGFTVCGKCKTCERMRNVRHQAELEERVG